MGKENIEVIVTPTFVFDKKGIPTTLEYHSEMYHERCYIIKAPRPPYDPEARMVEAAITEALSLTDLYPRHQIKYLSFPDGKKQIRISPSRLKR